MVGYMNLSTCKELITPDSYILPLSKIITFYIRLKSHKSGTELLAGAVYFIYRVILVEVLSTCAVALRRPHRQVLCTLERCLLTWSVHTRWHRCFICWTLRTLPISQECSLRTHFHLIQNP